jgi:solute carrier family 12 sodium/potassium/chloride transporter 2
MSEEAQLELGPKAEQAIRKEVAEKITGRPTRRLYGTFAGVFTPTLLTILGVIMYLREGWVVGNAGLLGAWLIILFSYLITFATGLSLSSITTNIRIGAGGAFSVISQSLGLEVGGSIGIPLYLAQTLAVAMYVFGFRAGWLWIFPNHPPLAVDLATFAVLVSIALVSAGLAFKVQFGILAVVVASLVSIGAGGGLAPPDHPIKWWGDFAGFAEQGFSGIGFWGVFAVFFPAATGIMAGANMSGELANPRRSIPRGTLSAIGVSLLVYLALAAWLALRVQPSELLENYTVLVDRSVWGPAVLAGILGATFSSALSSLVGAPRILQALAEHEILPASRWLARRSPAGEPRHAMLVTVGIVLAALMLRRLNVIAPLITMFFLITYAMINVVVLIEQSLGLVSFRPILKIPRLVSLIGASGCIFAMFVVNPTFALVAVVAVVALHAYLVRKSLRTPYGDVRSALFVAGAEWAVRRVAGMTGSERAWKPNLLIPVEEPHEVELLYDLLRDVAYPKGFVRLLGLSGRHRYEDLVEKLPVLAARFNGDGIFATWAALELSSYADNLLTGMEALRGAFFHSSIVFLRMPIAGTGREAQVSRIIADAERQQLGLLLYAPGHDGVSNPGPIHLVLDRPEDGWEIGLDLGSADLALLIAYKLKHNKNEDLVLTARLQERGEHEQAMAYLKSVAELARIPTAQLRTEPPNDQDSNRTPSITIFALRPSVGFSALREQIEQAGSPCLFALDSGTENALA